jgi:hypothetical protein
MSGPLVRQSAVSSVGATHTKMSWHFAADAHDARAVRMLDRKVIL